MNRLWVALFAVIGVMSATAFAVVLNEPWLDHTHTPPSSDVEP